MILSGVCSAQSNWKWLGKAPLDSEQTQVILMQEKGGRPNPAMYLSRSFIRKHLKKFADGASLVMSRDSFISYVLFSKTIGRDDNTCFVMPVDVCDEIEAAAHGNPRVYERALGFDDGYFESHGGLIRLDIYDLTDLDLRIPSGNEAGANAYWLPGGYTSGGVPEAVTNLIPKSRVRIIVVTNE